MANFIKVDTASQENIEKNAEYFNFAEKNSFPDGWLSDPEGCGITIVDSNGNAPKDNEDLKEKLKTQMFYVFTQEGGPFGLKSDDEGNILISDEAFKIEDIVKLPEKPLAPGEEMQTLRSADEQDLSPEEERRRAMLLVPEIIDDWVEPEIPEENKSETYKGIEFFYSEDVSEEAPEEILPGRPKELSFGQSIWDGFVKFFNGKGSEKGQAYRQALETREVAVNEYSLWKDGFKERAQVHNTNIARQKDEINRQKQLHLQELNTKREAAIQEVILKERKKRADNPDPLKIDDFEKKSVTSKAEEQYYADLSNYYYAVSNAFLKNPVAGMMDIRKNGLRIENIALYEKTLAEDLNSKLYDGSKLDGDAKFEIAHFLLFCKTNLEVKQMITSNSQAIIPGESGDFRGLEYTIPSLGDIKTIVDFADSGFFKDMLKEIEGRHVISKENLINDFNKVYHAQPKKIIERKKNETLKLLRSETDMTKKKDLAVKIGMLNESLENFDTMMSIQGITKYGDKMQMGKYYAEFANFNYEEQVRKLQEYKEKYYDVYYAPKSEKNGFRSAQNYVETYRRIEKSMAGSIDELLKTDELIQNSVKGFYNKIQNDPGLNKEAEKEKKEFFEKAEEFEKGQNIVRQATERNMNMIGFFDSVGGSQALEAKRQKAKEEFATKLKEIKEKLKEEESGEPERKEPEGPVLP